MNYEGSIMRNVLAQAIHMETRLSERQVMLLEWHQLSDHAITTRRGRVARLSDSTYYALKQMPVHGRYIFSTSPLEPILDGPVEPEEDLQEKPKRKRLILKFA